VRYYQNEDSKARLEILEVMQNKLNLNREELALLVELKPLSQQINACTNSAEHLKHIATLDQILSEINQAEEFWRNIFNTGRVIDQIASMRNNAHYLLAYHHVIMSEGMDQVQYAQNAREHLMQVDLIVIPSNFPQLTLVNWLSFVTPMTADLRPWPTDPFVIKYFQELLNMVSEFLQNEGYQQKDTASFVKKGLTACAAFVYDNVCNYVQGLYKQRIITDNQIVAIMCQPIPAREKFIQFVNAIANRLFMQNLGWIYGDGAQSTDPNTELYQRILLDLTGKNIKILRQIFHEKQTLESELDLQRIDNFAKNPLPDNFMQKVLAL